MIHPTRAFYHPNEPVEISVPGPFHATIWHLGDRLAELDGRDVLHWQPPPIPRRGYRVRLSTSTGEYWTAFDVLDKWVDAPRYGFLFDFSPERVDFNLDWLLVHHVNGLQFYDWQYRHDTLLPPHALYTDPLGRRLSLDAVRQAIDAAHARGMAAMPYTAIYAASPQFALRHREWGLYDDQGNLYEFANGFLRIMNPASPWRDYFVRQCRDVLDTLPFDGVHVDQYGEPRSGLDYEGQIVELPVAMADLLRQIRAALADDKALVFNLVHNWPLEAIVGVPVDFLYSELWPPQSTLDNLATVTSQNWRTSGGRPPVIAVYISPEHEITVRMVQSTIMASGGYHIAHGEDSLYLSDPYFPKSQKPSNALAAYLKRLADFGVAFGDLLAFAEPVDVQASVGADLWPIARRRPGYVSLSLVNASPQDRWNEDIPAPPIRTEVPLSVRLDQCVERIWCVSPDKETPPQDLAFTSSGGMVKCTVPRVEIWTLVCIQLAEGYHSEHASSLR